MVCLALFVLEQVPPKDAYPYEFVSREELFKNADIISLHCPLTDETKASIPSSL
mgnify:CR=1 FL=1